MEYLIVIISGSLNHTTSGRKRSKVRKVKKAQPVFKPLEPRKDYRRETPEYPSAPLTKYTPAKDESYKADVSKNYTVAIAYNKGAYQVIPKNSVKDIGK